MSDRLNRNLRWAIASDLHVGTFAVAAPGER